MKRLIAPLLRQYGETITVVRKNDSETVRAFLQPVMSRSWQNMQRLIPAGGQVPIGQFLYIGPPEVSVDDALELKLHGRSYLVRRVDSVYFREKLLFHWALLVEGGRDDPWMS